MKNQVICSACLSASAGKIAVQLNLTARPKKRSLTGNF